MECIFSVDVEDWFHILDIPSAPEISEWDSLPSHVEKNFRKLLDIFSEKDVQVTCFFLGWVAQRFPHLVREAAGRGHEIASHGYSHKLIYRMTEQEFFQDAVKSKAIIEEITGRPVSGYRCSGFSVVEDTDWFFDGLMEAGYGYDSSVFPAPRGHGGMKSGRCAPYLVAGDSRRLVEFPITTTRVFGRPLCLFGGGYLRFFPYSLIKKTALNVLREGRPVIFYIHPREMEPNHPRLPMSVRRRFKSYVGLKKTRGKIMRILDDFEVTTFERFIAKYRLLGS